MRDKRERSDEAERNVRVSIPNIPAEAVRWHLSVFNAITAYLTVTNTLFVLATQQIIGWQAVQYVVVGELLKAGGVALIVSPIITEASRVVIGAMWTKRKVQEAREEAHAEGREEGITEGEERANQRWAEWNQRREEAIAKGITFDEPPPQPETLPTSPR